MGRAENEGFSAFLHKSTGFVINTSRGLGGGSRASFTENRIGKCLGLVHSGIGGASEEWHLRLSRLVLGIGTGLSVSFIQGLCGSCSSSHAHEWNFYTRGYVQVPQALALPKSI